MAKKCKTLDGFIANMKNMKKQSKANAKKCPEALQELCETGNDIFEDVMDYAIDGANEVKETGACF